eukprot:tig00000555_g2148.t1
MQFLSEDLLAKTRAAQALVDKEREALRELEKTLGWAGLVAPKLAPLRHPVAVPRPAFVAKPAVAIVAKPAPVLERRPVVAVPRPATSASTVKAAVVSASAAALERRRLRLGDAFQKLVVVPTAPETAPATKEEEVKAELEEVEVASAPVEAEAAPSAAAAAEVEAPPSALVDEDGEPIILYGLMSEEAEERLQRPFPKAPRDEALAKGFLWELNHVAALLRID